MSTSVESTVAMPASAEPDDPLETETETAALQPAAGAQAPAASGAASTQLDSHPARKPVSPNVIISTLVALFVATLAMMGTLLMLQFNSLGDRIDALGNRIEAQTDRIEAQGAELRNEIGGLRTEMQTEIGGLRTEMQTEIGGLRSEMQAGFREINATLLDHTERLTRLETAAGLAE